MPAWTRLKLLLRTLLGEPIPGSSLGLFFDNLAMLLRTGMSLPTALIQSASAADHELQYICRAISFPLRQGMSLTQALKPYGHRLPQIVIPVLEAGEASGTLEATALRLADSFKGGDAVRRKFKYAVFDPWLVIIGVTIISSLSQVVNAPASFIQSLVLTFVRLSCYFIGGRLLLRLLFRWNALRLLFDTINLALPHVGAVSRSLAAARWARSFATLWNAGVPVSQALEISSRSALNAHYERALQEAARQTRLGRSLQQSLEKTQLLPAHLIGVITVGETSGSLGYSLEAFARTLEDEAFNRASQEFMVGSVLVQIVLIFVAFALAGS